MGRFCRNPIYETYNDDHVVVTDCNSTSPLMQEKQPGDTLAMMKYYTREKTDTAIVDIAVFDSVVVVNGLCTEQCSWKYNRTYNK
ncbi:MAG: hypothetical protein H6Q26_1340 [Bacteroidetes bacterium]|uniref:hypothetical protein n=1 Tax=Chitinophaga sp. LS1 TaxID=3051176 RepID=UPI001D7917B8|nr:hypothetical protein [Chitinophaga sp. LS1]MBP1651183.1 hypothetical protein [Bacteroidota bacterium]WPV70062.1 hypothetical protein QQL36_15265 [Chitinophaga sp. LS1]